MGDVIKEKPQIIARCAKTFWLAAFFSSFLFAELTAIEKEAPNWQDSLEAANSIIKSNPKVAVHKFIRILQVEKESLVLRARAESYLATILGDEGLYASALDYSHAAIRDYKNTQYNKDQLGWMYFNQGNLFYRLEDFPKARNGYLQAQQLFQSSPKDAWGDASVYNNLGLTAEKENKPEEALVFYRKGLAIRKEMNNPFLIAHSANYLAYVFELLNKPDSSRTYYDTVIAIAPQIADENLCDYLPLLVKAYLARGKEKMAMTEFQRLIESCAAVNVKLTLGSYLQTANHFNKTGQIDRTIKILSAALPYATANNRYQEKISILERLIELSASLGKSNYNYYVELSAVREQLAEADAQIYSSRLEIMKDLEQFQLELLSNQMELKRAYQARNFLVVIGVLLSFLIVALILRHRYISKVSKEMLEKEKIIHRQALEKDRREMEHNMELNQKELMAKSMTLAQERDWLAEFYDSLEINTNGAVIDSQAVRKLEQKLSRENEWAEFDRWFVSVHKDFYDKLKELSPDLSTRELKICALIKLRMSTKDISNLTGLASNSVDIYRSKIRRKLKIEAGENLAAFIDSLI